MRISDWSSDVCSSDLAGAGGGLRMADHHVDRRTGAAAAHSGRGADAALVRQRPCRDGKIVMAKVTLQGVKKNYGPVRAIHGIDMEIADGEFIVIVGPSGCGKSTLLRMIAGLEAITEGTVSIGDRVVNQI